MPTNRWVKDQIPCIARHYYGGRTIHEMGFRFHWNYETGRSLNKKWVILVVNDNAIKLQG